jgi:Skp family chaperone for outer membrane proteins
MKQAVLVASVMALVCGLFVVQGAPKAAPEAARTPKFGYVNLGRVMKVHPRRQELEDEINKLQAALRRDMEPHELKIERLRTEIEQLARGAPGRLALEQQLRTVIMTLRKAVSDSKRFLSSRSSGMLRELYGDIIKTVAAVGKEGNYDMIFKTESFDEDVRDYKKAAFQVSMRVVLYSKAEYDITDEIVRRVNDKANKTSRDTGKPVDDKPRPEPAGASEK